MTFSDSFVPQRLQKRASGMFAAPQWMQKFPAGAGAIDGTWKATDCMGLGLAVLTVVVLFVVTASPLPGTSERRLSVISLVPLRNSLSALPMLRPISGNLLGPKTSNATTTIITIWMGWIPSDILVTFLRSLFIPCYRIFKLNLLLDLCLIGNCRDTGRIWVCCAYWHTP